VALVTVLVRLEAQHVADISHDFMMIFFDKALSKPSFQLLTMVIHSYTHLFHLSPAAHAVVGGYQDPHDFVQSHSSQHPQGEIG
jgi:hypothetical protein